MIWQVTPHVSTASFVNTTTSNPQDINIVENKEKLMSMLLDLAQGQGIWSAEQKQSEEEHSKLHEKNNPSNEVKKNSKDHHRHHHQQRNRDNAIKKSSSLKKRT